MAAILALQTGCKKNDEIKLPPLSGRQFDVIITASLFNPANSHYEGAYFLNGSRQLLPSGGSNQTFPYGIDKANNNLYIAGAFTGKRNAQSDEMLLPCYWKNGQKIDLSLVSLNFETRCAASDIKWFNGQLFILGDADMKPVLWREENSSASITHFGFDQNVLWAMKTSNMQVYNNKLYIGGNQQKKVNGQTFFNVGYWTVDQYDKMEYHVIEDNLPYALCFSITVSDKGIFLAGEVESNGQPVPVVFTDKGRLPVSNSFNPAIHRLHSIASDSKGNTYLNVLDIGEYKPAIWKVPQQGEYSLIKPSIPLGAKGFCQALDIRDDQLAHCYSYELGDDAKAAYMFNEKNVELDIYNNPASNIHSLRLFPK